jgi:hypothetical protein
VEGSVTFFDQLPDRIEGHPSIKSAGWGQPPSAWEHFKHQYPIAAWIVLRLTHLIVRS